MENIYQTTSQLSELVRKEGGGTRREEGAGRREEGGGRRAIEGGGRKEEGCGRREEGGKEEAGHHKTLSGPYENYSINMGEKRSHFKQRHSRLENVIGKSEG